MPRIREELSSYLEECPGASYQALTERFGQPEQIAATYVECADTGELLAGIRYGSRVVKIVSVSLLAALIIWAAGVTIAVVDSMQASSGYSTERITVTDEIKYLGYEKITGGNNLS